VATISLYQGREAVLDAYQAEVGAAGVVLRTHGGRCLTGVKEEGAYTPGDDGAELLAARSACFTDSEGHARYLAIIDERVLLDVEGRGSDPLALQDWAWRGNRDAPGAPTAWRPGADGGGPEEECVSASYDFAADARGAKGDPLSIARAALMGLQPGDTVELDAGTDSEAFVMVNRDRAEIGRLYLFRDPEGGWLLGRATLCAGLRVRMD
jgi:hypothetical protein